MVNNTIANKKMDAQQTPSINRLKEADKNRSIFIVKDKQVSLEVRLGPKVTWEWQKGLRGCESNRASLLWALGDSKIKGKENAGDLARPGSSTPYCGPEPALKGPKSKTNKQNTNPASVGGNKNKLDNHSKKQYKNQLNKK